MKILSYVEVRKKGLNVLFKELGEPNAIRFLSQIRFEKRDYLTIQDELFKGMDVDEIFERAKEYQKTAKTKNSQ